MPEALDMCSHPAVRLRTEPGVYPATGFCGACGRLLGRAAKGKPWTYTRRALQYGESIKAPHTYGMFVTDKE